jgi:tetratricopeptide (TPR) repeat protein
MNSLNFSKARNANALLGSRRPLQFLMVLMALGIHLHADPLPSQAQAAWAQRDQPGQTEKAIDLWQKALKENPNQPELWINVTKALGRAVRHASATAEKRKWADQAREAGEKAVTQNPQSPEAWAYNAEAIGQWANAHKGPGSLRKVRQAVDALKKSIAMKPDYAYAHMLLAEFYRQAPAHISVGDKKKALEEAKLAVTHGPGYAINHIAYARALIDNNQKASAIAELRAVLILTPPRNAVPETHADQETARELLKSVGAADSSSAAKSTGPCSEANSSGAACGH